MWWLCETAADGPGLVVADDVHVFAASLLRRRPPAAHVLAALPLLLSFRRLLLQLLTLVLRPAVLEPDLHLQHKHTGASENRKWTHMFQIWIKMFTHIYIQEYSIWNF